MTTLSDKVPVTYPGNDSGVFGYSLGQMHPRRDLSTSSSSSPPTSLCINPPTARAQHSPPSTHLYQTSSVVSSMAFGHRESEVEFGSLVAPERVLESMQIQYPHYHQNPPQGQDFQYNPLFHAMGHEAQDLDLFPRHEGPGGVQGSSTTSPLFGSHTDSSTGFAFAGPFVPGYSENIPVRTSHGNTLHPFAQVTVGRHRSPSSGPSSSPTLSYSSRSASSSAMSSPTSPNYDDPSSSSMVPSVTACASCKRSHIKCDSGRPCQSCLKHPSKAKTCRDASPKPRGRPKGGSKAAAEAILMARVSQQQQQQLREQQHHQQLQMNHHPLQHFPQQPRSELGPQVIRYTQNLPERQGPRLRVRSLPQAPKSLFVPRSVSSSALTSTLPPLAPPLATASMHPQHYPQQQQQSRKSSVAVSTPPSSRCASSDSRSASPATPLPWRGRPIRSERRPSLPIWCQPYPPTSPPSSVPSMMSLSTSSSFTSELSSGPWSNVTTYPPYIYQSSPSISSSSSSLSSSFATTVESASAFAMTYARPMLRSSSMDTPQSSHPTPFLPTMTVAPFLSTSGPMVPSLPEWSSVHHPLQGMNGMGLNGSPTVDSMSWSHFRHPQQHQQQQHVQSGPSGVFPLTTTASPESLQVDQVPCDLNGLDMTLGLGLDLEENQSANGSFLGTGASTSQLLHFEPTPSPPLCSSSSSSDNVVPKMEGDAYDQVDIIKQEGEDSGKKMARLIQQHREVEAEIHLLHRQQQQQQQQQFRTQ